MEYQSYTIRKLLDSVLSGGIRIPAFQRGFVWDKDRVAYLMDSIYKQFPFGSLLFWRTRSQLAIERELGQFQLPSPDEDYPIDYVLDGQQRLTSIFSVFQTQLTSSENGDWSSVYFNMNADEDAQDSQFLAIDSCDVDKDAHFPLFSTFRFSSVSRSYAGL